MTPPSIAVVDTGICNLRSVTKALEAVGGHVRVVTAPGEIGDAAGLVLPGVGALRDCVASLRASGMDDAVRSWIALDRAFLGVCLGMQALFDYSEEGGTKGLGIFQGRVIRFRRPATVKIPHMGWNTLRYLQDDGPWRRGLSATGEWFYFVHSFHCEPEDESLVLAECDYGGSFCAAVARGNVAATQFHPEKSQSRGLQLYRNFVEIAAACRVA